MFTRSINNVITISSNTSITSALSCIENTLDMLDVAHHPLEHDLVLSRLIQTWMATESDEEITKTVSGLSTGNFAILSIVKALGEYLTSEEEPIRTKGIAFLTSVLQRCTPESLNRQSVHALATFYRGKLDDSETTIAGLQGLIPLSAHKYLSSDDAIDILKSLFRHIRMKALAQSVRFHVFTIVDAIMARHREDLKNMGDQFLTGYIALAEGEKDPRNLLLAFAIARVILIEFNITQHLEGLYNITFCYFPITFRPPPNDPYGITTEDLIISLRNCLSATPAFGPLAIPVFLEKLTAGSPVTKRDTLQTIALCLPVYGPALARSTGQDLWNSLKIEIFQPIDAVTEEEALATLVVLVQTLVSDVDADLSNGRETDSLCKDICKECIEKLREPEKSQAKPSARVLSAFIASNTSASRHAIAMAIPSLIEVFLKPGEGSNRPPILSLLSGLLKAIFDTNMGLDSGAALLVDNKDDILGIILMGIETSSCRRFSIDCLLIMISLDELLNGDEIGFVVRSLVEKFLEDPGSDETNDALLELLAKVGDSYPQILKDQALPMLFAALPDHAPSVDAVAQRERSWQVLSALGKLCLPAELFEVLVIRLITKFDMACFQEDQNLLLIPDECRAAHGYSILKTLSLALARKVELRHPDVPKYIERFIPNIFNWFLYAAFSPASHNVVVKEPRLLRVAAEIIATVTRTLPSSRQTTLIASLMSAFFHGEFQGIICGYPKITHSVELAPFKPSSPGLQFNLVILFNAAVCPLRRDVTLSSDLPHLLETLINWAHLTAQTSLQRESTMHALASLLNKHSDDLSSFLGSTMLRFWSEEIANTGTEIERRKVAVEIWVWVTKSLLVSNHPAGTSFAERLLLLFSDSELGWAAAKAVGQIGESDTVLTKSNYATVKILVLQKYVHFILPRLIQGAKDLTDPIEKQAHLVALCALIKAVPKETYQQSVTQLLPLLLMGMDLHDSDIRANVIDTLYAAAPGEATSVEEHSSTLVDAMLKFIIPNCINILRVRIAALRFLALLPSIVRYNVLYPCKAIVIRELAKALDDPKRTVRKEAVDARSKWLLYEG